MGGRKRRLHHPELLMSELCPDTISKIELSLRKFSKLWCLIYIYMGFVICLFFTTSYNTKESKTPLRMLDLWKWDPAYVCHDMLIARESPGMS